jgi:hypothetical protein
MKDAEEEHNRKVENGKYHASLVVRARGDEQGRERRVAKDTKFEKLKESYILEKDANTAIYKRGA